MLIYIFYFIYFNIDFNKSSKLLLNLTVSDHHEFLLYQKKKYVKKKNICT